MRSTSAPLPDELDPSGFTVEQALQAGISRSELEAVRFARPFPGVRTVGVVAADAVARARAYRSRLADDERFSHATAAAIHGLPLPARLERAHTLHVTAGNVDNRPRVPGLIGHRSSFPASVMSVGGLPVSSPVEAWCELGTLLSLDELVILGDFLVTGTEPYNGARPLATIDELQIAVAAHAGRRGIRRLTAALLLVRFGSLSPRETLTRLLIVRAGLQEPHLNHRVFNGLGVFIAMVDLAYPDLKIAIEYQGPHHRDAQQYERDLARRALLEDAGWIVIEITKRDIEGDASAFLIRLRSRLASRAAFH